MRRDLWTDEDSGHEAYLRGAVERDDLIGALLAIEGAPEMHWDGVRSRLRAWGEAARRLADGPMTLDPADAVVRVLAEEAGFEGDSEDYGHPRNSHLTQVIARRRGLPIVLASIYATVAKHAGFDACGVGMPGHYIVRVEDVFLDPFNEGASLTAEDCETIVRRITAGSFTWSPKFIADTPIRPTVERVLRNLVHGHQQQRERLFVYRAARLLAAVSPHRPETQLLHARLAEEFGAHRLALDLYESIIETFPDTSESKLAATRLGPLHTRARMLN